MANDTKPELTWVNIIATIAVIATLSGGAWILFQAQFTNMKEQFAAADASLSLRMKDLQSDLSHLISNVVQRQEHIELVKRLDERFEILKDRIEVLETSRPTTGELQAVASTTKEQISEMKERLRSLEDNLRRPQQLAPITPPLPTR